MKNSKKQEAKLVNDLEILKWHDFMQPWQRMSDCTFTITVLTVHNSCSSRAIWPEACQQLSCHFLHLALITRWCRLPQNIPDLPICTNSPKAPCKFRFASNHLYGNGVLLSVIQSLYWYVVKFKVRFFDIWKVPTMIEGWPQNSGQCRYSDEYAEQWQIYRNTRFTCISLCNTHITNRNKAINCYVLYVLKYFYTENIKVVWNRGSNSTCWMVQQLS